ncbi:MAG TPA: error-prone DNA polymerase [Casimicrobium sp.]|nr:error-prone DNA polymerase [Casimicrobium sp.]
MLPVYAELYCRSNFSFQQGASKPEELVRTAFTLGYRALAITDECSLAGSVRAHLEWKELCKPELELGREPSLRLITGACFCIDDNTLILLAKTRLGYATLTRFITCARQRTHKGEYAVELADLADVTQCHAIIVPGLHTDALLNATAHLPRTLGYSRLLAANDAATFTRTLALATTHRLSILACGDVLTHDKARQPLQDILTAVRHGTTVDELGALAERNAERVLRPINALAHLYPLELMIESAQIADACRFTLDELRYEYPDEVVPPGHTATSYLAEQTWLGAKRRYHGHIPTKVQKLLNKELKLITEVKYEAYFLTVYDIVKEARRRKILCQGRGSAANSAVCYCLGITELDPSRTHVLFERFVSKERDEPPDIDVDFEHQRREEIIQYIYTRYGRERAALCATVVSYRTKGALRDVGKALGFSLDQVDRITKNLSWWDKKSELDERLIEIGFDPNVRRVRQLMEYTMELIGFPRHLSQHPGGFVIARGQLDALVPIENATMPDRTVIQWDKDDIEALGLMKVDILGLGMLSCLRRALELVSAQTQQPFTMQNINGKDPKVFDMLCRGESTGVFQVESRAQMNMLPRLRPRNYFDLVVQIAIVRPGPIQGGMVHPYLQRRQGLEKVRYPSPAVEGVLKRTLGIPIFQEQVMELSMVAAGFTPGEADLLRRSMAAWKRKGGLGHLQQKLTDGMLSRGYTIEFANSIYKQIEGFGSYGFPESHAASFAILAYASAWLKHHFPAAFCCALLNSQPMGFYSPSQLVQDARKCGVTVLQIDINESDWDSTLVYNNAADEKRMRSNTALRLGLRLINGLAQEQAERIVSVRKHKRYVDIRDVVQRTGITAKEVNALTDADAFRSIAGDRIQSRWIASAARVSDLPLAPSESGEMHDALTPLNLGQDVIADFRSTGLTLRAHPLRLLRPLLRGTYRAEDLKKVTNGQRIRVAGLVTCRQRPGTASGVTFVTLEDETGNTNVVVWRDLAERERRALIASRLMIVHGTLEHQGPITHLVANHMEDASHLLADLMVVSHDFH